MSRAEQVKALIRAYGSTDAKDFYSVALQMAADEAQRGHVRLATELRDLVEQLQAKAAQPVRAAAVPLMQPRGELAELLTVRYPQEHLNRLVVSATVETKLTRLLTEQRHHALLRERGLRPRRKLLLVGPPGTGKTLTASVVATELKLPLFIARFDSLITKFMGESASKLRIVFEALKATRGVYLFDEFDSLGLQRGAQHDVAEMRRTLNVFLQLIENDPSDSVILAASNHGSALDTALYRRFDDVVQYDLPDSVMRERLLANSLASMAAPDLDYAALARAADGLSQSEIVSASQDAMKDVVLARRESVGLQDVQIHLRERTASSLLSHSSSQRPT